MSNKENKFTHIPVGIGLPLTHEEILQPTFNSHHSNQRITRDIILDNLDYTEAIRLIQKEPMRNELFLKPNDYLFLMTVLRDLGATQFHLFIFNDGEDSLENLITALSLVALPSQLNLHTISPPLTQKAGVKTEFPHPILTLLENGMYVDHQGILHYKDNKNVRRKTSLQPNVVNQCPFGVNKIIQHALYMMNLPKTIQ